MLESVAIEAQAIDTRLCVPSDRLNAHVRYVYFLKRTYAR